MTVEEIERACDGYRLLDFSRPELPKIELSLRQMFYPYGFPVEVRTNSAVVLSVTGDVWGRFEQQHHTEPIRSEVIVVDDGSRECPPAPLYHNFSQSFVSIADRNNYSIVDMERNATQIGLTAAALRHRRYASYYFLATPVFCIGSHYTTPLHAACVALHDHGILLCGDSGAGKSTLSYACARDGWTYITDDGSYLLDSGEGRTVAGNCHQFRLRPNSARLFPELGRVQIDPHSPGKPTVELSTTTMEGLRCEQTTRVDFIVFLNRDSGDAPKLVPYRKDVTRYFMQQMLYGPPNTRERQHAAIERLLTVNVFELHYTDSNWAVQRLQALVRDGE